MSTPPAAESSGPASADRPGTLKVSEIFTSLQGEGPSIGQPCVFLRLAGCNLNCAWCDTAYSWDFRRYSAAEGVTSMTVATAAEHLLASGRRRLVVTGGEPLLQQDRLAELLAALPAWLLVEVETNGTLAPTAALVGRVGQWNVSPKLASAEEPAARRIDPGVLRDFAARANAWLKLVVADPAALDEVEALVTATAWPRERVLLMPEASDRARLEARLPWVAEAALARGFGVSTRLQVALWGGERGR